VFAWSNEDYEGAGAYVRAAPPSDPIRLQELPSTLAEAIASTRIDTSFAESDTLQLADHFAPSEVITWGDEGTLVAPTPEQRRARDEGWRAQRGNLQKGRKQGGRAFVVVAVAAITLGLWWLTHR
jgi:hypothetical protein